ncbi:MAG: hypothetical protein L0154_21490 [Chloroflexi bacterium]|nr:hypothetical protein [Chloroflexota bacterium]
MKRLVLLFTIFVLILPHIVMAQDDWQTYTTIDDILTFSYPADWELYIDPEEGSISLYNDPTINPEEDNSILDTTLESGQFIMSVAYSGEAENELDQLFGPGLEEQPVEFVSGYMFGYISIAAVISAAFSGNEDAQAPSITSFETREISGMEAGTIRFSFMDEIDSLMTIMLNVESGAFVFIMATAPTGELDEYMDTINEFLNGIEINLE